LFEVDAINTFRGPAHILHGVSLTVDDGEVARWSGAMALAAPPSSRALPACRRCGPGKSVPRP
jgi:hypothetical protein